MAMQEGYSTQRPPYFDGNNFAYWRSRMEYYLMTEIDMWFSVMEGFTAPKDAEGKVLESAQWTTEQKRKAQANAKATVTLQCGLAKDQLNKVGPFSSARDLWNKLIELNEGTRDSRIAKRDLYMNQLQNFAMRDNETVSELHGRIKELLNGLHSIGESLENRDTIRYALKAFPQNTLWSSMVDAYKVIDARRTGRKRKKRESSSSSSESSSDGDDESSSSEIANFVRRMMRRSRKYNKNDVKKIFADKKGKSSTKVRGKTDMVCFECNRKGHIRSECPDLAKEEDKQRRKKALKATWDDSSSSSSEDEVKKGTKHRALMALNDSESEEDESMSRTSQEVTSSDDDEVTSPELDKLYETIACLTNALSRSKNKVKLLKCELEELRKSTLISEENETNESQVEELRKENNLLLEQVNDLKCTLEKFTTSSNTLNMILDAQRAVYNKAGIGYKPKQKEFSFMSLVNRTNSAKAKVTKAWIPKKYLIDANEPKIWVPKDCIFRV
ncbi:uncharacterized protein LOC141846459 [Curcuma longa]|uniref:uncharacterized protein LOC141846459 n=1 Tax=Curcuma longa TaxID=136217 RepID=UPI003D9F71B1